MHSGRRLLTALTLPLVFAGACSPQSPPSLPMPEVKPLTVPMPAAPGDASLFGYLKLRDLGQTLNLFGGPLVGMAYGLNLAEVQPGKPAALYLWDPAGVRSPQTLPAAALLPVPPDGAVAGRLKTMFESVETEAAGEGTLAAMNTAAAERSRAQRQALSDILNAPVPFDALLYLNAATILDTYMPVLQQGVAALEPILTQAAAQRRDSMSPKATIGMFQKFLSAAAGLKAVAVGLKPYDGGLEASVMVQDKQPSQGGPVAAPDLGALLPPADLRIVWNNPDVKRTLDFYMGAYGPMLDEKPGLRAQVQALVDEWLKASRRLDSATALQLGGERAFSGQGIMRVDNPAAMLPIAHKVVQLFNQGPVHDAYKSLGVDLQIAAQPKARKLRGWTVDRFEYRVKLGPELTDPTVKSFWERLNGTVYEVARIGPYLVFATNASIDTLVNGMFSGAGPAGKGRSPLKATAVFPPGGTLYVDLNVPGLLSGLKSLMPAHLSQRVPTLPPQPEPVTLFGYDSGETGYYKLRLPGPLLAAIKSASR